RIIDGTPARVETLRHRSQGDGVINTAYIERLNATFRACLAPLARRCRALARHTLTLHEGMFLVGTVYNFCTPHTSLSHTQQTTIGLHRLRDQGFDCASAGDIDLDVGSFPAVLCDHMDGLVSPVFVHVRNDEFRPFPCKRQGGGSSNP